MEFDGRITDFPGFGIQLGAVGQRMLSFQYSGHIRKKISTSTMSEGSRDASEIFKDVSSHVILRIHDDSRERLSTFDAGHQAEYHSQG